MKTDRRQGLYIPLTTFNATLNLKNDLYITVATQIFYVKHTTNNATMSKQSSNYTGALNSSGNDNKLFRL